MTVKELYFANDGWLSDTKLKVLGKRDGVLYEGVFIDMPDKIVNSRVVVLMITLLLYSRNVVYAASYTIRPV